MQELTRRRFLILSGKTLIPVILLSVMPGAGTNRDSDVDNVDDATRTQTNTNLQSHTLPDFEAWMLSTNRAHIR